ncbi:MAG TPA: hypothetical protein VNK82_07185 [Terriglobales bacterium]|nr:hypothetical protein [Terriglobales bacterium]
MDIERLDFRRVQDGSFYAGKSCEECDNAAEFEYAIWYEETAEPRETGALCGVCAAVILLQETATPNVSLEKLGPEVRVIPF